MQARRAGVKQHAIGHYALQKHDIMNNFAILEVNEINYMNENNGIIYPVFMMSHSFNCLDLMNQINTKCLGNNGEKYPVIVYHVDLILKVQ